MNGIVLLAHGSRDPDWVTPFELIRAKVERRRPRCSVLLAFLNTRCPIFATAVDQMVTAGTTFVSVIPLFLGSGGHVRRDVPELLQQAMRKHPRVKFEVAPFVGDADAVLDAIADYVSAANRVAD